MFKVPSERHPVPKEANGTMFAPLSWRDQALHFRPGGRSTTNRERGPPQQKIFSEPKQWTNTLTIKHCFNLSVVSKVVIESFCCGMNIHFVVWSSSLDVNSILWCFQHHPAAFASSIEGVVLEKFHVQGHRMPVWKEYKSYKTTFRGKKFNRGIQTQTWPSWLQSSHLVLYASPYWNSEGKM